MGKILNLGKVNTIKREQVRSALECIDAVNLKEPVIDKVIIFGSSVRDDCCEESDVDMCIFTDKDGSNIHYRKAHSRLFDILDYNCDILNYRYLASDLKKEIEDTGVVVYER